VLAAAFARAASRYWLEVFPTVRREVARLHAEARRIPDPTLRRLALDAQRRKWASLEGAAAFAAFAPSARRQNVTRLLVGFQAVYDYADTLMEQPSEHPALNAVQLHAALIAIAEPDRPQADYYRYHVASDDGGYLDRLVDACRAAVGELPAYRLLAGSILENTQRIIQYQSRLNLASKRDHPALARAAAQATQHHARLRWWETWAACGSSLAILALLVAAADPAMDLAHAAAIEAIYWPWAGALHTLLDGLIDRAEDAASGQHNLLDHYNSPGEAAEQLGCIAAEAARYADAAGVEHHLILAGMASLYLADPEAWTPAARPVSERVLASVGEFGAAALFVLRVRRLVRRIAQLA
jgi:tetraprenyl-beta-curcumene synthase